MLLLLLHEGHPGISRTKCMGKSKVWWPGIDKDIESFVKNCSICRKMCHCNPAAPNLSCTYPDKPLHLFYDGPVENKLMLIIPLTLPQIGEYIHSTFSYKNDMLLSDSWSTDSDSIR